nr:ABC transporter ATP-binding protein [uncultured Oribacterium sp.]
MQEDKIQVLKILSKSIREFKKDSILCPLLVTGEVILECMIPFFTAQLVNRMKENASMQMILHYGLILVVMAILSLLFGLWAGNFAASASTGFARNIRKDMFKRIQGFSFENIDRFESSSLVTRLTTDISNVQMAYMMLVRTAFRGPLMMVFSFAAAFIMGGRMAIIFCFVIPILAIGLIIITKKAMKIFNEIFKRYDALNESVEENIQGMRVVKTYVREEYEKEKFNEKAESLAKDFISAEKLIAIANPLMQFCLFVVVIFVLSFGSYLVVSTGGVDLDVGQLSALLTYSYQILSSLMLVAMVFVMVVISAASSRRIAEVLTEDSTMKNPENGIKEVKDGSIDFNHVYFKYSKDAKKNVLTDISLHISSGQTVGILGGTGSAKSSLTQLISRLYDVTEGEVLVGGEDVRNYDLQALRDQVAVVLQKNILFSGTVAENLRWGNPNATQAELEEACRLSQASEFIEKMKEGYESHVEQGGSNFSGGQKQRLCIARALLKKPKVLILDDSTSAVDTKTDAFIRKGFKEFIPDTTKIIIAQRISSVMDADQILIMDKGEIIARGTHEELMENSPIYRETYESQNRKTNY